MLSEFRKRQWKLNKEVKKIKKQEQLQWEQQTLGQALDILCDDNTEDNTIIIFGAEHLTPAMKKVLEIKKED